MFVPYTIANPLTTVRIARRMSRPGEVLVRLGENVEPAHIIAQAVEPPDFRIVNVSRELNVPVKRSRSCLKVSRGDAVAEGDTLAARGGLSGLACYAPIDGTVVGIGRGRVLLEADPYALHLTALVPGQVVEVWPGEGVLLETIGAHLQMAWGNGMEAYGSLQVVVRAPRHPIRPKHLDASAQGAILVGGSQLDAETLERAVEMQIRGIIVGSVLPSQIPLLQTMDFPIVATEGIGSLPMSRAMFDLLRSLDGRDAAVSGRVRHRGGAERPYAVVPMPAQAGATVNPESPIEIGSRVRVLRGPHTGVSGTVLDIPKGMIQLETGARLMGVQVDFGGKEVAFVPYANLERLL